ncbi:hypothetical protein JOM56_013971 [Amanita muscaria]
MYLLGYKPFVFRSGFLSGISVLVFKMWVFVDAAYNTRSDGLDHSYRAPFFRRFAFRPRNHPCLGRQTSNVQLLLIGVLSSPLIMIAT